MPVLAILLNPTDPTVGRIFDTLTSDAKAPRSLLGPFYAGRADELEGAFHAMRRQRVNALMVQPGMFWAQRTAIVKRAADSRLPAIYAFTEDVDAGGLMSYGASIQGMLDQAVRYVDKILRGAKVGELPVQEPTKLDFVISLKTAKALGLTIPQSLLLRADRVIESTAERSSLASERCSPE